MGRLAQGGISLEPVNLRAFTTGGAMHGRQSWQTPFHRVNVWSREKEREKLDYMHANPVQNKLVANPRDWPWSSFSYYATGAPGVLTIDVTQ